MKEEVGLDVSQCPGGLAYTYHRENPGEGDKLFSWMFTALSLISRSLTYRFRQRRHLFKIATLDEIKELAAQGVFLHYDSIKQVFES